MPKIQNIFPVVANEKLCARFYRMQIDAPSLAGKVQPGQFIHIRVTEGLEPFFRRPFSVHRAKKYLEIFYEVVGRGTSILSGKRRGEKLDVLGPLGNSFTLPQAKVKKVVMVAGGIGVAPFLTLSDALRDRKFEMVLLYGGRTKGHVFSMKEYKANGCRITIATDDGSVGVKGRVTRLLEQEEVDPKTSVIYTCGPWPMMAAVQRAAQIRGINGQASCEEVMACGLGACLGCSIRTASGYRTVCHDGPVFDLKELLFEPRSTK